MLPESMEELVEPLLEVVNEATEHAADAQAEKRPAPQPGGSVDQGSEGSEASGDDNDAKEEDSKAGNPERPSPIADDAKEARMRVQDTAIAIYVPAAPHTSVTVESKAQSGNQAQAVTPAGGAGRGPITQPEGCQSRLMARLFGAFALVTGLAALALVGLLATSSDCGCACLANATYSG
jgi:hypothetical protein